MLSFLRKHFIQGKNYLIRLNHPNEIDLFFSENLYNRTRYTHKKEIWGKASQLIQQWGSDIGWVSDTLPMQYLSEKVELEIAEAFSSKNNNFIVGDVQLTHARLLLQQFHMSGLADRNPFFLSKGESKLVWLLSQWAKSVEYLIIGNILTDLSDRKCELAINFILNSTMLSEQMNIRNPIFVLGYSKECEFIEKLKYNPDWMFMEQFPLLF